MLPAKFGSIWLRSPFCQQIWLQRAILVSDWLMLNKSFPLKSLGQMQPNIKVGSIWPSSFRGEDVLTLANQKQELLLVAMFVGQMEPYEEA
jgi:hypothetical protein